MDGIISENVILKPMDETDRAAYVAHVTEAKELYIQYGIEPSEYLIECIREPTPNVIYYSIVSKDKNVMVGYVGITPGTDGIEFYVFKEYRRQGYGSEAVAALTIAYLTGAVSGKTQEKVVAETLSDNGASIALHEKIGYRKQAVGFRLNSGEDGNSVDCVEVYAFWSDERESADGNASVTG